MYSNIDTIDQLHARVKVLEEQQAAQWMEMKDQVHDQYERLKPANLIHNAFGDLSDSLSLNLNPDADILREGAAMASGMLVNALLGKSKNKSLKKWATLAVFTVATYFITNFREEIIEAGNKAVAFVSDRLNNAKVGRAARKARKEAEAEMDDDMEMD
jgi:hypothetical protein